MSDDISPEMREVIEWEDDWPEDEDEDEDEDENENNVNHFSVG